MLAKRGAQASVASQAHIYLNEFISSLDRIYDGSKKESGPQPITSTSSGGSGSNLRSSTPTTSNSSGGLRDSSDKGHPTRNLSLTKVWLLPKRRNFPGLGSSTTTEVSRALQAFLERIASVEPTLPPSSLPWPTIFHNRTKLSLEILSSVKTQRILESLEDSLQNSDSSAVLLRMTDTIREMYSYLSTHTQDPDNSLLGLIATPSFVSEINKIKETARCSATYKWDSLDLTSPYLLELIQIWATNTDDQTIGDNVRAFSQLIPDNLRVLKKGTLILVQLKNISRAASYDATKRDALVFARVKEESHVGEPVKVSLTPEETDTELADRIAITILPPNIFNNYQVAKNLSKVVVDPSDVVFKNLTNNIGKHTEAFLQQQGVDVALIRRAVAADVNYNDRLRVETLSKQLEEICTFKSSQSEAFLAQISDMAKKSIQDFTAKLESCDIKLFPPTHDSQLSLLTCTDFNAYVKSVLKSYLGACQGAQELVQLQRKELSNGSTKKTITDWYLKRIKDEVNVFLKSKGYDLNAVPDNYIEQQPADMDAVKRNLQIIQSVLGSEKMKDDLVHLVEALMTEIYAKLDAFTESLKAVICEELGMSPATFQIDDAQHKYDSMATKPPFVGDMIKDIKYTNRMKYLDKTPSEKVGYEVVPISGLIVGRLCRFENELKTVLQVWNKPPPQPQPQQPQQAQQQPVPGSATTTGNPATSTQPNPSTGVSSTSTGSSNATPMSPGPGRS